MTLAEHSGSNPRPVEDQILRFVFVSGMVAERRGNDETVGMSFELDVLGLIDYVISIHLETGEVAFFTRDGDTRLDEEIVLTMSRGNLTKD